MTERIGRHIVIGMAGHIDHGKTALVKALTGTDTDRLKEEKERGMTTDLGFAFLGEDMTIIDVPGHEKFVKTMVAGVNTVDLGLLVIAADDGVMPQTVEHLEILNLLHVPCGLIALNKIDMADEEWIELVEEDIRRLTAGTVLENAPVIRVSAVKETGIDNLRHQIFETAKQARERKDKGVFRMPVDRVFTIKGFGTVTAGTVLSGKIAVDDTVELLPQSRIVRVRGLQVHDKPVQESLIGYRTAVNLQGIEKDIIERGNVLAEAGFYTPSSMIDAIFHHLKTWDKKIKNRSRVRVHIGTDEVIARVVLLDREFSSAGEDSFIQLHFERPVTADMGDRYVIRSYSPVRTIGGGMILDAHPAKHKRFQKPVIEKLQRLLKGDPSQAVAEQLKKCFFIPQQAEELAKALGMANDSVKAHIESLESAGEIVRIGKKRWLHRENQDILRRRILAVLTQFHETNPIRINMPVAELRSRIRQNTDKNLFEETLQALAAENRIISAPDRLRLASHKAELTPALENLKKAVIRKMLENPFSPPDLKELSSQFGKEAEPVLSYLTESGEMIRMEDGVIMHTEGVEAAKKAVREFLLKNGEGTISEIRQHLGTTRKYAVPLMSYLDSIGLTERFDDKRKLKE